MNLAKVCKNFESCKSTSGFAPLAMQVTVILSPSLNSAIPLKFGDLADVEVRMGGIICSRSGTMSMSTYTDRDRGVSKAVLFTWQVRFDPGILVMGL